jgi:hypothetical protein
MSDIIGKWVQGEDQPYPGLWFEFNQAGTFKANYEPMGIVSSGTYTTSGDSIIMDQTAHTLNLIGEFKGLFKIKGDVLKMSLASGPGQEAPSDLSEARTYQKQS